MSKETKARNRTRQEEEHADWRALSPETKAKVIEARKVAYQNSLEKREAEKIALKAAVTLPKDPAFEAAIVRGREFNKKVKPLLFVGRLFGYDVSAAAILRTDEDGKNVYYEIAYCIRARRDAFSYHRGLSLAGYRLEQSLISEGSLPLHPSRFKIHLSPKGSLKKPHLAALIHAHLMMDAVTQNMAGPGRMMHIAIRNLYWEDNRFVCVTPDTKPEKKKKEVSA